MKEDTIVIETGSDRSKMRLARWAIQSNTPHEAEAAPAKPTAEKTGKINGFPTKRHMSLAFVIQ